MPRRPNVPCGTCGKLCWPSKKSGDPNYQPPAVQTCHECRRARPGYSRTVKRPPGDVDRWTCAACGTACERPATKGQRPKWCESCRALSRDWVPANVRRSVYVRDDWTCWLCEESVDASLIGSRSEWRPSLDHVVPRSKGGSDDPTNLRLAHWWCNIVRCDERAYSPEDFRVAV